MRWEYPRTLFLPPKQEFDYISINEDYTFKNRYIKYFTFKDTQYDVSAWSDALLKIVKLLYDIDPTPLYSEALNKSNIWISNKEENNNYKKVTENIYVCTGNDTNTKIRIMKNLLSKYELEEDDIYFGMYSKKEEVNNQ